MGVADVFDFPASIPPELRDLMAQQRSDAWAAYHWHVRNLVAEAAPDLDEEVCAGMLLAALSARTFFHQRRGRGMALERLKAGWGSLVRRLLF